MIARPLRGALLAAMILAAVAGELPAIELVPRMDTSIRADLSVKSLRSFEADISLTIRTDPARVSRERALELVRAIDIRDGEGVSIRSGMDINMAHGVVMGFR